MNFVTSNHEEWAHLHLLYSNTTGTNHSCPVAQAYCPLLFWRISSKALKMGQNMLPMFYFGAYFKNVVG